MLALRSIRNVALRKAQWNNYSLCNSGPIYVISVSRIVSRILFRKRSIECITICRHLDMSHVM